MFHNITNNHDNIAIPPILVPSVVHGQHRHLPLLATDLCTLHNITNNHDNMAILPILVHLPTTDNTDVSHYLLQICTCYIT